MNKPLCVVSAPPDTYSGYGARSRDFIKALIDKKGSEWDIKLMSQRWGQLPFGYIKDQQEEWGWMEDYFLPNNQLTQQPDYWFQITVPNEFQPIGKWNCGITAGIETTACHQSWLEGCNRMNLVLVSSNHAKKVFQDTRIEVKNQVGQTVNTIQLTTPVEILFEGLNTSKFYHISDNDIPVTDLVSELDEVKEEFCYLFVGHWLPGALGEDRKNVGYLVKTFLETFKNRRIMPALILKVNGSGSSITDRESLLGKIDIIKKSVVGRLPNIYLLHGDLSEEDMNYLYNHPKVKVMVSLTKGEGFGRPLLEFTQAKKPIIASGWSGHLDFLDPQFTFLLSGNLTQVHPSAVVEGMIIPESGWFTPDPIQTNSVLLETYNNYAKYIELAKRQAYRSKIEFSLEAMADTLEKILNEKATKFEPLVLPKMPTLNLPKLKKIETNEQ